MKVSIFLIDFLNQINQAIAQAKVVVIAADFFRFVKQRRVNCGKYCIAWFDFFDCLKQRTLLSFIFRNSLNSFYIVPCLYGDIFPFLLQDIGKSWATFSQERELGSVIYDTCACCQHIRLFCNPFCCFNFKHIFYGLKNQYSSINVPKMSNSHLMIFVHFQCW